MTREFRILLEAILLGVKPGNLDEEILARLVGLASRNKVLLHFLRVAGISGWLREREESRYARFIEVLGEVERSLSDVEHVYIKLLKPVAYVPSDIDVLVPLREAKEAIRRLARIGFRIETVEPYCVTLRRRDSIIDVYLHPTKANIVYIDGTRLLDYTRQASIDGVTLPVLQEPAEAVLTAAHAIYKERLYTLNDLATIHAWLDKNAHTIAEELHVKDAVVKALQLNQLALQLRVTLPYRIPLPEWILLFTRKILGDRLSAATLPEALRVLRDPRLPKLIHRELTKKTY